MTIQINPVFIQTKNVRNFSVMMKALDLGAGEGRLALVWGRAGRGKTLTSQYHQANNGGVYMRMNTVWRTSELYFLQALARELGIAAPAGRKGPVFAQVVDALIEAPRPIFLDEIEKLSRFFLDIVRDLSDLSACPIILVGEAELYSYMRQNRRVWSRTYQQMEFTPIDAADIVIYTRDLTGGAIKLPVSAARILHQSSDGDFRIVRRDILQVINYANGRGTMDITDDLVKTAIKTGLSGRK